MKLCLWLWTRRNAVFSNAKGALPSPVASLAAVGYGSLMIIVTWDGKNLPAELRNLPPGTYAMEPTDAPELSPEDEEGLRRALRSIDEGRTVAADEARRRVRAAARG